MPALSSFSPPLLSVLRIVAAFLFLAHGTQKLYSFPVARAAGEPELFSLLGVAGMLEAFGGALLLIGLFTRPVAFILCGQMAVAYFIAHAPQAFWPLMNGGELAVLYAFVFLYIAAAGGGPFSVDGLFRRRA